MGSDPYKDAEDAKHPDFNPRSPCGERQCSISKALSFNKLFQSTLPVWGATKMYAATVETTSDFNPRSPCGERLYPPYIPPPGERFQSTLPVWGATVPVPIFADAEDISIHAPRVGSDAGTVLLNTGTYDFNPRSPCGERLHVPPHDLHTL